jgi:hypothetical protein
LIDIVGMVGVVQELGGIGWDGYCGRMNAAGLRCFNSGVVLAKQSQAAQVEHNQTKPNKTEQNQTKRNKTKQNQTKENEIKRSGPRCLDSVVVLIKQSQRCTGMSKTKQNETKQNETNESK